MRLKANIGESGEMQHRPEAITAAREVMTGGAAVVAGFRPQKITSRSPARMSGSYLFKFTPSFIAGRGP